MNSTTISIVVAVLIVFGAILFSQRGSTSGVAVTTNADNTSIVDGKQIVTVLAKGGYFPQKSVAKSGIPTFVRFTTNESYDCSSSIRIPSLDISRSLPQTGTTDIEIGTPSSGIVNGTCGMGMYSFEINFIN